MEQENWHAHSPVDLEKHLRDIEEELKKPVDDKTMRRLFQKLEVAQEDCSSLKEKYSLFAEKLISESEDKIRSLFGKVVTSHMDTEVDQIVEMAQHVPPEELQKKIKKLKSKYCLSKEQLEKIAKAEKKESSSKETDLEEVENLFRLASLVYHKNKEERNKIYCCLSTSAKESFHKHLICLKTKAFEKEESTIQALFASALEIAGSPPEYPSSTEIQDFFSEEPPEEK